MAGSFNKVILLGNLTRDPELRYTPQGTAVSDIGLAVNDTRAKQGEQARPTFVDITFWDRSAEVVCEYCRKGSSILVEGRLQTDSWEDRETGKRVYKLKVVAQSFQFTGTKNDNNGGGNSQGGGGYSRNTPPQQQSYQNGGRGNNNSGSGGNFNPPQESYGGFDNNDFGNMDDDIPF